MYLDEYEAENQIYGDYLHYYNNLPEFLHEMSPQEILNHINRNGVTAATYQKIAISNYIRWLAKTHGSEISVSLSDLNYELTQLMKSDEGCYIGFYTLTELKQAIEKKLQEFDDENSSRNMDFNGLKSIFFLEWYGVAVPAAITIKLTDVSDDGKQVYVADEDRTVTIADMSVSSFFAEYKQKTGFKKFRTNDKIAPYYQNTFYRTTVNAPISTKSVYNARAQFQSISHDNRFDKKRVYNAGRYFQMLKEEQDSGNVFACGDKWTQDVINKVFNFKNQTDIQIYVRILRDYRLYKMGYIERL